jgi:hypothetical protein
MNRLNKLDRFANRGRRLMLATGLTGAIGIMGGIAALGALGGCAALIGPREVTIPLTKLQGDLNARFPLKKRYLEVFDISLNEPKLTLQSEQNRLQFEFAVTIAPPLTSKRLSATLALSGALEVDPARHAVVLTEPRVENMQVDGVDTVYGRQFAKLGSFVAERVFKETPVYRIKDEDLRVAGVQFVPTRITVARDALQIRVEPVK